MARAVDLRHADERDGGRRPAARQHSRRMARCPSPTCTPRPGLTRCPNHPAGGDVLPRRQREVLPDFGCRRPPPADEALDDVRHVESALKSFAQSSSGRSLLPPAAARTASGRCLRGHQAASGDLHQRPQPPVQVGDAAARTMPVVRNPPQRFSSSARNRRLISARYARRPKGRSFVHPAAAIGAVEPGGVQQRHTSTRRHGCGAALAVAMARSGRARRRWRSGRR
jgi:hypothetical protein